MSRCLSCTFCENSCKEIIDCFNRLFLCSRFFRSCFFRYFRLLCNYFRCFEDQFRFFCNYLRLLEDQFRLFRDYFRCLKDQLRLFCNYLRSRSLFIGKRKKPARWVGRFFKGSGLNYASAVCFFTTSLSFS